VRVASWRDSASQQAQDDLDGLVNAALPFATGQLDKHGEFFPYGVALNDAGEARTLAGDPDEGEHRASSAVRATIVEGLRRDRDDLRAVALVADVRLADGDAVRVELEHRDGHAIVVLLPYKKKRFGRGVEYGTLKTGSGAAQVWSV
jgi:hypothetical protein